LLLVDSVEVFAVEVGERHGVNADVENEPSRGGSDNALYADVGIARPSPVITPGIRPE
jgi:hypothetical protein